ncbi:MAG: hypothetical protein AAF411_30395, partial [Myxococcota bacterium]
MVRPVLFALCVGLVGALGGCSLLVNRDEFELRDAAPDDESPDEGVDGPLDVDAADTPDGGDLTDITVTCPDGTDPDRRGACGAYRTVSVSSTHACAIRRADDRLVCWGSSERGGAFTAVFAPIEPAFEQPTVVEWVGPGLADRNEIEAWDVAVSTDTSCFVLKSDNPEFDRRAYCIGDNTLGRAGRPPAQTAFDAPQSICVHDGGACDGTVVPQFESLHTANNRFCGITVGGGMWCWGRSAFGSAGVSTQAGEAVAPNETISDSLDPVVELALASETTCARFAGGRVQCFGWGREGQLGRGTAVPAPTLEPASVVGTDDAPLTNVEALYAESDLFCARVERDLLCWGDNDRSTGSGPQPLPRDAGPLLAATPLGLSDVSHAAFLDDAFCYWNDAAEARCRGAQTLNPFGTGPSNDALGAIMIGGTGVPLERVASLDGLQDITGEQTFCAFTAVGALECWGYAPLGQVPNESLVLETPEPVRLSSDDVGLAIESMSMNENHLCAVVGSGSGSGMSQVYCSGIGGGNERGDPAIRIPFNGLEPIEGTDEASAVVASSRGGCAALADRTTVCWGLNNGNVFGSSEFRGGAAANQPALAEAQVLSIGDSHGCGLFGGPAEASGDVQCWGSNDAGETLLAGEGTVDAGQVILERTSFRARDVSAGRSFSCAVLSNSPESFG